MGASKAPAAGGRKCAADSKAVRPLAPSKRYRRTLVGCGRPEDALQELAEGFLAEFNSSWRQHGPEALTRLTTERAAQSRGGAAPLKAMCHKACP